MFLIMSAAYVGQELESEFGMIPPSFLPLGNRRLFQHQVALAPQGVRIYISVPESYTVSAVDSDWLKRNNVDVLYTPDGLSLGASLVAALNLSDHPLETPLHILYGDTLFRKLPIGNDLASISISKDSYNWALLTDDSAQWLTDHQHSPRKENGWIIDGYFNFSQPRTIIKNIIQSKWDFIQGLNRYHQDVTLTSIISDGWLDFGHVNTYYRSKAKFTTQRAFNELKITPFWIEKSSANTEKISAEAAWFSQIPPSLRSYTPQFLGSQLAADGAFSYRLEYLYNTALNELFVFSKLPSHSWQPILTSCIDFLQACRSYESPRHAINNDLETLFGVKTLDRLTQYCNSKNITLEQKWHYSSHDPVSLSDLLAESNACLPNPSDSATVLHGDFCFSNILYDFRAGKIKTIDPRGMTPDGHQTIYGDLYYDLAKLSHSVLGLYDWIIAGHYYVEIDGDKIQLIIAEDNIHKEVQEIFISLVESTFSLQAKHLYAMQIHLFLSMLPLHADDPKRQQALFANAFRLYHDLKRLSQ